MPRDRCTGRERERSPPRTFFLAISPTSNKHHHYPGLPGLPRDTCGCDRHGVAPAVGRASHDPQSAAQLRMAAGQGLRYTVITHHPRATDITHSVAQSPRTRTSWTRPGSRPTGSAKACPAELQEHSCAQTLVRVQAMTHSSQQPSNMQAPAPGQVWASVCWRSDV